MNTIGIIGGGLAGLVSSILLARNGYNVSLFEEKTYPFHRVCGEYISNETLPFLKQNGLFPDELHPSTITHFQFTSPKGRRLNMPLDLGGFGISRYTFDHWLCHQAMEAGVAIITDRVKDVKFSGETFEVSTRKTGDFEFHWVIGSFGKRSTLDSSLKRAHIGQRSPYIAVKYHIKTDLHDPNLIALHNFKNGYCGISKVENETFNLCYLSHRSNLSEFGSIDEMEQNVLFQNPHLKSIFSNSEFLFEKPEVINEISFSTKSPLHNHILMIGDSAGMIAPLCGNGMAIAIHSAKIISDLIGSKLNSGFNRDQLETEYMSLWKRHFSRRLWAGRSIQHLFGSVALSELALISGKLFPFVANTLMSKTHGKSFS